MTESEKIRLSQMAEDDGRSRFEVVYRLYRDNMFYTARQILRSDADAEDAVHEALLAIWTQRWRLDTPQSPRTRAFVLTVTSNKAIDLWRRQRQRAETLLEEPAVTDPTDIGLKDALTLLPAAYRTAILLRYDMGLTPQEIGQIMDRSEGAVCRLLHRAKQRLSQELDKLQKEVDAI